MSASGPDFPRVQSAAIFISDSREDRTRVKLFVDVIGQSATEDLV